MGLRMCERVCSVNVKNMHTVTLIGFHILDNTLPFRSSESKYIGIAMVWGEGENLTTTWQSCQVRGNIAHLGVFMLPSLQKNFAKLQFL